MNTQLPKTIDVTIYLYLLPGGDIYGCTTPGCESQGWTLLSTDIVTMDVPDVNPIEAELEQLGRRETAVRNQFDDEIGKIKGRRAELLALFWQPGGDAA